ncbi:hypothetical protein BDR22DRAFT_894065 [Usnea florida]
MFFLSSFLLSVQIVTVLTAAPLGIINPPSVAGSNNISPSPLNSTALTEADSSAQAMSMAALHSIQSSRVSPLNPPGHVKTLSKSNSMPFLHSDIYYRNITLQDIEDVEYTVPGTDTTLHMTFRQDRPLQRRSLGGYLILMQDQIEEHISTSHDSWLLPADDPYKRNWPGFYFIAKSSPLPIEAGVPHLTYGIMKDTLKGFFDIMYVGAPATGPLPYGCYCNIVDGAGDLLGTAIIWASPVSMDA